MLHSSGSSSTIALTDGMEALRPNLRGTVCTCASHAGCPSGDVETKAGEHHLARVLWITNNGFLQAAAAAFESRIMSAAPRGDQICFFEF